MEIEQGLRQIAKEKVNKKNQYELLAQLIHWQLQDDKINPLNITSTEKLGHPLRTTQILLDLQNHGLKLQDLEQAVFSPRMIAKIRNLPKLVTSPALTNRFIVPFLAALRDDRTLAEVAHKLQIKTLSTYHHWETGRRDIPFAQFLKAIDVLSGRLVPFIESLPFKLELESFGLGSLQPGMYHQFFDTAYTPTVFLALRVPDISNMKTAYDQAQGLARRLKLALKDVEKSIDTLVRLKLVYFDKNRLVANPKQLYAIPSLPPQKIQEIHNYWFSKSRELLEYPGFHKVEQHAVSIESKEKIILWISELREKIRDEVKKSGEPETLIHINWQLAEIL